MTMSARGRWAAYLIAAAVGPAAGAGPRPPTAPVPPTQEIEVLDPGVDPTGNPAAIVRPDAGLPGVARVDIPPAVLVHKFYYTGDRSFQGPMLPGGPTIVAAGHPKTGERVYVPVTLPPGAPRVTYTSHAIRYDYGPQAVTLAFGPCGKPHVIYGQATAAGERARGAVAGVSTGTRNFVERTGLPQGLRRFGRGARDVLGATADRVNDASRLLLLPVVNGVRLLPGAQLLRPSPEESATRDRARAQRVADRQPDPDQAFVPRSP